MLSGHFLEQVQAQAKAHPERIAIVSDGEQITYGDLWTKSDALANAILSAAVAPKAPIAIYGHKSMLMFICFLACAKSGHAYVPLDISMPMARIDDTLEQIDAKLILAPEHLDRDGVLDREAIEDAIATHEGELASPSNWVCGEDVFYMIFTSGSTGKPKGIMVTESCLSHFYPWALGIGGLDKSGMTFMNQAPFSFDLSVYELSMSLASGGTLFCLTAAMQADMRKLFAAFAQSHAQVWVSTPSFAEMCLADKGFGESILPDIVQFIFCGETLLRTTAKGLLERFPKAQVLNTYGPTESTVAVTSVNIDMSLANADQPLPVGYPKPGTAIRIIDEGGADVPADTRGEILIEGDTVSRGYYGRQDLTDAAFGSLPDGTRTFRTGDEGYLDESGCLHYVGRLDFQIKLHGFRIELGDIEYNIESLPYISAVVAVPIRRGEGISGIAAFVCLSESIAESDFKAGQILRHDLEEVLPHYMIPRKVVIKSELPRTGNGKVDRKKLEQELA